MLWLHVTSPQGVEAEFTIDSPVLALDLALRSLRSGFRWQAENRTTDTAVRMSLTALRHHAIQAAASSDADRQLLDEVEWQHELLATARLN
jgi:hypothetical protein